MQLALKGITVFINQLFLKFFSLCHPEYKEGAGMLNRFTVKLLAFRELLAIADLRVLEE